MHQAAKGFTLMEFLMVIVVIGILVGMAIPRFYDFKPNARKGMMADIVQSVQEGVTMYGYNKQMNQSGGFPSSLDVVPNNTMCAPANRCFEVVLTSPYTENKIRKVNSTLYEYDVDGDGTYNTPGKDSKLNYSQANESFYEEAY